MTLRSYQSMMLQPGKSTSDYISYRAYANSNFMVRQREVKSSSILRRRASALGSR